LHFWSLAVEEQFYFILPFLVYIIALSNTFSSSKTLITLYLVLISSISVVLIFTLTDLLKFYFLFSRIWEFLAGALVYLYEENIRTLFLYILSKERLNRVFIFIQIMIMISFIFCSVYFDLFENWPNGNSLIIVLLSSIFIGCKSTMSFYPLELLGILFLHPI
jgi:peptidoglycan/LPS O-acetylase OafA/YrhL